MVEWFLIRAGGLQEIPPCYLQQPIEQDEHRHVDERTQANTSKHAWDLSGDLILPTNPSFHPAPFIAKLETDPAHKTERC